MFECWWWRSKNNRNNEKIQSNRKNTKNKLTNTFNSQGYDANHPDIDLMRLRNYTIGASLTEAELLNGDGFERVSELLGSLKPFITYLNSVVMPDEAESESEDEGEEEDDDDEEEGDSAAESSRADDDDQAE